MALLSDAVHRAALLGPVPCQPQTALFRKSLVPTVHSAPSGCGESYGACFLQGISFVEPQIIGSVHEQSFLTVTFIPVS